MSTLDYIKMEELILTRTYNSLSVEEKELLLDWCADESTFNALKESFSLDSLKIDDTPLIETKRNLDQLFDTTYDTSKSIGKFRKINFFKTGLIAASVVSVLCIGSVLYFNVGNETLLLTKQEAQKPMEHGKNAKSAIGRAEDSLKTEKSSASSDSTQIAGVEFVPVESASNLAVHSNVPIEEKTMLSEVARDIDIDGSAENIISSVQQAQEPLIKPESAIETKKGFNADLFPNGYVSSSNTKQSAKRRIVSIKKQLNYLVPMY